MRPTQKNKDIKNIKETKQKKLSCQGNMYRYYCLRWSLSLIRLYLCASTVYSKASLVLSSFRKRRTQQIMASGVVAMNLVRVPKLRK